MSDAPLISAIMPTRRRPHFVGNAHRLWSRSSWPNIELIPIVDEDDAKTRAVVDELAAADPRVRPVRSSNLIRRSWQNARWASCFMEPAQRKDWTSKFTPKFFRD